MAFFHRCLCSPPGSKNLEPRGWRGLKLVVFLIALMVLAGSLTACGSVDTSTHPVSGSGHAATLDGSTTSQRSYLNDDGDGQPDDRPMYNDDTILLDEFGKEAPAAERAAIGVLVKRYYEDAASGNGVRACPLLAPSLVAGLSEGQSSQGAKAGGCAATVSRLFEAQRTRLKADDVATMVIVDVRVRDGLGLVAVGFKRTPLGMILVKREAGSWKLNGLFDSVMP